MKVEVLVATMKQKDLSKYRDMNLCTDAIFANQDDRYEFIEQTIAGNTVKMITTTERGVGKNRNTALMYASGEICLFADDDISYVDHYETVIADAFKQVPQAGILIFNIETAGDTIRKSRDITAIRRVHVINALNYGAPRLAVRRDELLKKNIYFSMLYGGGAPYSAGEDSLFILEAIRKGIKVYTYPVKIADIKQDTSTWFSGYNEKYYIDKGVWLANAFPMLKYLLAWYYSIRLRGSSEQSISQIFSLMKSGIHIYKGEVSK